MLPRQGAPVQALVGELTSHMPQVKPKKKNNVFFFFFAMDMLKYILLNTLGLFLQGGMNAAAS